MALPLHRNHLCMGVAKMIILLSGMFFRTGISAKYKCEFSNTLFISDGKLRGEVCLTPNAEKQGNVTACFSMQAEPPDTGSCCSESFDRSVETTFGDDTFSIIMDKDTLSKQNIVLMTELPTSLSHLPLNDSEKGVLLQFHERLNMSKLNERLTQGDLDELCEEIQHDATGSVNLQVPIGQTHRNCVPIKKPEKSILVPVEDDVELNSPEKAKELISALPSIVKQMGNSSLVTVTAGNVTGVIARLPVQKQKSLSFGRVASGDIYVSEGNGSVELANYRQTISIPSEAIAMAREGHDPYAAVMFFPDMHQDDPGSVFLENQVMAIEMGPRICNLSKSIEIKFSGVKKNGSIFSCRSWDGEGGAPVWTTDGCQTHQSKNGITCLCSHLTFFSILMSPPAGNMSASDSRTLTIITSTGCGLSLFFLVVALTMHCLIRKGKASLATQLLIQLFIAMSALNLSFLLNESIANLGNFGACVAMAAFLHYGLLATFTWFFMQALHLILTLHNIPPGIALYFEKICIAGWVTPAGVVIVLVILQKYGFLHIHTDDGGQESMCWIPDAAIHQGVNIGYYALVFLSTFSIFIATVQQIILLKAAAKSESHHGSTKKKAFVILGLLIQLGVTWATAFFSHGPLRLAFTYIFTILNAFQGFFLFIYFYKTRENLGEDKKLQATSSTLSTPTVLTSPYT